MIAIERAHTPNFERGRKGFKPEAFVIHVTEGSAASALDWFSRRKAGVSAHYLVTRQGKVYQFVGDEDTAWHAGRIKNPRWNLLKPGINPNLYTIGIEHEGSASDTWTPKQLAASAELIINRAKKHAILITREKLVEHRLIYSGKTCPGNLDVDRLHAEIILKLSRESSVPRPGEKRWSNYFGEYLILTNYVSDDEWYYARESDLKRQGIRASTPWSLMPER